MMLERGVAVRGPWCRLAGTALLAPLLVGAASLLLRGCRPKMYVFAENDRDLANMGALKYALEAYPAWHEAHPERPCPSSISELDEYMQRTTDPWNYPYVMRCESRRTVTRIVFRSRGADGKLGTADDIVGCGQGARRCEPDASESSGSGRLTTAW